MNPDYGIIRSYKKMQQFPIKLVSALLTLLLPRQFSKNSRRLVNRRRYQDYQVFEPLRAGAMCRHMAAHRNAAMLLLCT